MCSLYLILSLYWYLGTYFCYFTIFLRYSVKSLRMHLNPLFKYFYTFCMVFRFFDFWASSIPIVKKPKNETIINLLIHVYHLFCVKILVNKRLLLKTKDGHDYMQIKEAWRSILGRTLSSLWEAQSPAAAAAARFNSAEYFKKHLKD